MLKAGKGRRWRAAVLAIVCLGLAACGHKTLPIPPADAVPEPIRDLRYQQDENQVVLTWTYPKTTTAGTDLPGLHAFLVSRAVVPNDEYCSGCPVSFSSVVEVEAGKAIIDGKKRQARYTETILRPGHHYVYKVQTKAGWRLVSDDSNTVGFAWDSPAAAPAELLAEVGDGQVVLRWPAVAALLDGQPVSGAIRYQVYRSMTPDNFRAVGDLVDGLSYTDTALRNGQTYYYQVRAVREKNGTKLIGFASPTAEQTPRDLTPPAPPRNLTGVLITGGVKLLWEHGSDTDLAGYRIYRRLPEEKKPTVIGEVARGTASFVDQLVEAPGGCYWAVTAFDSATPPNESDFSKELYHEPF